ncbi:MAG: hypothetical protein IIB33_06315 [Chloroflexi bacterium]|nr:hypothetical protein [Chloroflexota bacterium]
MDWYMAILRFIHVLFAIVWVGGTAFVVLFFAPALRRMDPEIGEPVMLAVAPRATVGLLFSAGVVFLMGMLMVLNVLGLDGLGKLFSTDWGRSILMGFLFATVLFGVGIVFVARNVFRMRAAARAGIAIEPAQAMRMESQLRYGAMTALAFGILALGAMMVARDFNP